MAPFRAPSSQAPHRADKRLCKYAHPPKTFLAPRAGWRAPWPAWRRTASLHVWRCLPPLCEKLVRLHRLVPMAQPLRVPRNIPRLLACPPSSSTQERRAQPDECQRYKSRLAEEEAAKAGGERRRWRRRYGCPRRPQVQVCQLLRRLRRQQQVRVLVHFRLELLLRGVALSRGHGVEVQVGWLTQLTRSWTTCWHRARGVSMLTSCSASCVDVAPRQHVVEHIIVVEVHPVLAGLQQHTQLHDLGLQHSSSASQSTSPWMASSPSSSSPSSSLHCFLLLALEFGLGLGLIQR